VKIGLKMKNKANKITIAKTLQDSLANIPFLEVGDVSISERKSEPDFQAEVHIKNQSLKILANYSENGEPRLARLIANQIKDWVSKGIGDYGIFIAPYISPDAATVCSEAGIGYLDLAGNCLLSFDNIFIHRDGKANPQIQRRKLRSLYSSKAERILRVLLTDARQNWKTDALAKTAKVSYGQVSKVKSLLADREWLAPSENGIRLSNPTAVLEEWATQYRYQRNQISEYYSMADIVECEYQLAEACQRQKIRYSFTAFSGAARFAPSVRYQRISAYMDGDPDPVANILGWKRVTSGANVGILIPYDEGVFFNSQEMSGVQIATPVQIYIDLQSHRNRGQEAANNIRKVIEQSW
jgi:hypothetical protein